MRLSNFLATGLKGLASLTSSGMTKTGSGIQWLRFGTRPSTSKSIRSHESTTIWERSPRRLKMCARSTRSLSSQIVITNSLRSLRGKSWAHRKATTQIACRVIISICLRNAVHIGPRRSVCSLKAHWVVKIYISISKRPRVRSHRFQATTKMAFTNHTDLFGQPRSYPVSMRKVIRLKTPCLIPLQEP